MLGRIPRLLARGYPHLLLSAGCRRTIDRCLLQTSALSSKPAGRRCLCRSDVQTSDHYIDPAPHNAGSVNNGNWNETNTHTRLTALCPGLPRWAGTRKVKPIWISLKQETVSGSGISWAKCKSAPRSRQITTPAPHYSVFYRPDALPATQPTASKHWNETKKTENKNEKNWK